MAITLDNDVPATTITRRSPAQDPGALPSAG
jgi:hypothetical protein